MRFYATGSYQNPVGNQEGLTMSQPSVSRCVHAVTDSINNVFLRRKIRFPLTAEEINAARLKFANAMQPFHGAIGAVDCTHVSIRGPSNHEEAYVNRYGYHSLNVQVVSQWVPQRLQFHSLELSLDDFFQICDPDYKILNINARFPGARHDAYIWSNSPVRRCMERNFERGERHTWLIGKNVIFLKYLNIISALYRG